MHLLLYKKVKDVFAVHYVKSRAHTYFDNNCKIQETSEVSPKLCPTPTITIDMNGFNNNNKSVNKA